MTAPYSDYALQLYQIIDATQNLVNDFISSESDGRMWTREEIRYRVQESLLELAQETGMLRSVRVIPLTEDLNVYSLPGDCIRPVRIMMNGLSGHVVMPKALSDYDIAGDVYTGSGEPYQFFRDNLEPDEIGLIPVPGADGSTSTVDTKHGMVRSVQDAGSGEYLPFDAGSAPRRLKGVPSARRGRGRIIYDMISTYGNLQVWYIRSPVLWEGWKTYPDEDFPEWLHKDFKYGAASKLLVGAKKGIHRLKGPRFMAQWARAIADAKRWTKYQGQARGVVPL